MHALAALLSAADARLIEGWRRRGLKLWSIQIALFWGALSGLAAIWPALSDLMPTWVFAALSVAMCCALAVARLTKQPGAE